MGLIMILGLLGIIAYHGFAVFWPQRVVELELKPGTAEGLGDRTRVAGIVTSRQVKTETHSREPEGQPEEEWQLFLGNKDYLGTSFKYFDRENIQSVRHPDEVMILERAEYGDAIVYPTALEISEDEMLPADDPQFLEKVEELLRASELRRATIREIDVHEIGAVNRELEALRLRALEIKQAGLSDESERKALERIEAERNAYEADFRSLRREAQALRAEQEESKLHFRLASGEAHALSLGSIYHLYFPNQLGFLGRLGVFINHIWNFLSSEPREANTEGGVFPAIFGTFVMTLMMSLAVTPFGVLAAIYLREYAHEGTFVRMVRISINNLAGVPSIVFGVFGLGFFVYLVGGTLDHLFYALRLPTPTFGTGGILWASLTLALMTVPVVIVATEEALSSVPQGVRESSMACGASKWQTIQRLILPASAPGILTGMILAMARGAGEVAPLMLVGVVKVAPTLPIDGQFPFIHLERKFMHLGFHIYDLGFQSPDSEAAMPMVFATTLLLITLIVLLNLAAILLRNRLRRKYLRATI